MMPAEPDPSENKITHAKVPLSMALGVLTSMNTTGNRNRAAVLNEKLNKRNTKQQERIQKMWVEQQAIRQKKIREDLKKEMQRIKEVTPDQDAWMSTKSAVHKERVREDLVKSARDHRLRFGTHISASSSESRNKRDLDKKLSERQKEEPRLTPKNASHEMPISDSTGSRSQWSSSGEPTPRLSTVSTDPGMTEYLQRFTERIHGRVLRSRGNSYSSLKAKEQDSGQSLNVE